MPKSRGRRRKPGKTPSPQTPARHAHVADPGLDRVLYSFGSDSEERSFDPELAELLTNRGRIDRFDDLQMLDFPLSTPRRVNPDGSKTDGLPTCLTVTDDGGCQAEYATTAVVSEFGRERTYRTRDQLLADLDRLESIQARRPTLRSRRSADPPYVTCDLAEAESLSA